MSWKVRRFCDCGCGLAIYVSFNNPWFFHEELCACCGARLQYHTHSRRVRWHGASWGIFRKKKSAFWEIHPGDDPLPFDTRGFVRHAEEGSK